MGRLLVSNREEDSRRLGEMPGRFFMTQDIIQEKNDASKGSEIELGDRHRCSGGSSATMPQRIILQSASEFRREIIQGQSIQPYARPAERNFASVSGDISLLADRKCKELVKDFERVSYKPETNVIDKDHDRMRTHLSDALGYLLWQECRVLPKVGERQERLF